MRLDNIVIYTVMLGHLMVDAKHDGAVVRRNKRPPNRPLDPFNAHMGTIGDRIVGGVIWHHILLLVLHVVPSPSEGDGCPVVQPSWQHVLEQPQQVAAGDLLDLNSREACANQRIPQVRHLARILKTLRP